MEDGRRVLRAAVDLAIEDILCQAAKSRVAADWRHASWMVTRASRMLLEKAASERSVSWSGLTRFIAEEALLGGSQRRPYDGTTVGGMQAALSQTVDIGLVAAGWTAI